MSIVHGIIVVMTSLCCDPLSPWNLTDFEKKDFEKKEGWPLEEAGTENLCSSTSRLLIADNSASNLLLLALTPVHYRSEVNVGFHAMTSLWPPSLTRNWHRAQITPPQTREASYAYYYPHVYTHVEAKRRRSRNDSWESWTCWPRRPLSCLLF